MNLKLKKACLLLVIVLVRLAVNAEPLSVIKSPNGKIVVELQQSSSSGIWSLVVKYVNDQQFNTAVEGIQLGLRTDGADFTQQLTLVKGSKPKTVIENYTALHGKKKFIDNKGVECDYEFKNSIGKKLIVQLRAYNDGIAFKYLLPGNADKKVTFIDELTTYQFDAKADRWLQKFVASYEGFYNRQEKGIERGEWGYPALFSRSAGKDTCWMLITEAGMDGTYCATKLSNIGDANKYKLVYPAASDGNGVGAVQPSSNLTWSSPWRVIIMGNLGNIVESTLVDDLSPANKIADTSWIRLGASSWVYWANNHGTKDYKKLVDYIDLAARMNWPYTLFDWEWDAMTNGGKLEDAVKYAASKGIKTWMWYNSGGPHNGVSATPRDRMLTHENRVQEFTWLKKMGIYGVKVDFFESDKQQMINYYLDILKDAAEFKLMVNFHGATVPRGWSRTYPNLMSMEAVYGAEQYNNGPLMTTKAAAHNATLPFTRNVIGPMDYTPVTFTNSQHAHTTSYAHELALSVIFESGIQHFADRPEGFDALPDAPKSFLKNIPVSWDETKFITGFPGKLVVLARRKGSKWYLAGINGQERPAKVKLNLNFLTDGKTFKTTTICDGEFDTAFKSAYSINVKSDSADYILLPRGGFVVEFDEID